MRNRWWDRRGVRPLLVALVAFLSAIVAATVAAAQPLSAKTYLKPTPCTPRSQLFGRDTILALGPCSDLAMLEPHFRAQVECVLARMDSIGHWRHATVVETYRSNERQQFLYAYGRTKPGTKVTNAKDVTTSVHGYALAVDIIHSTSRWDNPKFFYSLGQHAEACGLVAGAFWKRFPDGPHVQSGLWQGAPPLWARALLQQRGPAAVWAALYPTMPSPLQPPADR